MVSSKKLGRMVTADVDKALANIGASTPKPEMKDAGAELKAATAGKNDLSFAEKFKANRMAGNKTFTYNGKTYTTKMAGEGAKKAAPVIRRTTQQTGNSTNAAPPPPATPPKGNTPPPPPPASTQKAKPKGDTYSSGVGGARSAAAQEARKSGKSSGLLDSAFGKWVHKTNVAFQERQKKKYGKAAGGSIDGAAIRGKTRAMRKGK